MNEYSECVEYLHALGMPLDLCEKVRKRYEDRQDMEGLLDYILLYEMMVDSCVG